MQNDDKQQAVASPIKPVVRRLYRLSQIDDVQPWNEDHAYSMIICAENEFEARKLAKDCEHDRECGQLWDANHAKIEEISLTKGQVIQVA